MKCFFKHFEERFALEKDADGSGAQLPRPSSVELASYGKG